MSMRADLVTRLLGHTPLVAIVGSAVSWFEKDRGDSYPALILNSIPTPRDYAHDGWDGIDEARVQFDAYATDPDQAEALGAAVIPAMEAAGIWGATEFGPGFFEGANTVPEGEQAGGQRLYRMSFDFTFHHKAL